MDYRPLGRTDLKVSAICLGTMTWGEQNTEDEAHEQLDAALDRGINFIDVAETYPVPPRAETQGLTEAYVGRWLKARNNRDKVILAAKVAGRGEMTWLRDEKTGLHGVETRLDRPHMEAALEASLTRLQTDYFDLYQLHWPDRRTNVLGQFNYTYVADDDPIPIEETLGILGDFVKAGKVRHVGLSNEVPWGVMHFLKLADTTGLPRMVSIQNPYNLLNRTFEIGLAEITHREAVGLLPYSPMAMGALSGKYLNGARPAGARLTLFERFKRYSTPRAEEAIASYVALAERRGLDAAQMALAFVNSRPFVTSTVIGATTVAQLEDDIASIDVKLDDETLEEIEAIHLAQPNPCP